MTDQPSRPSEATSTDAWLGRIADLQAEIITLLHGLQPPAKPEPPAGQVEIREPAHKTAPATARKRTR